METLKLLYCTVCKEGKVSLLLNNPFYMAMSISQTLFHQSIQVFQTK